MPTCDGICERRNHMKTLIGLISLITTISISAAGKSGSRPHPVPPQIPAPAPEIQPEKRNLIETGMNRSLVFEGSQVTEKQLIQHIRRKVAQDRDVKFHVLGHPWNQRLVVDVIDLCQRSGAWNITFATARG